ncbi:MAG TPA: OmpH family outer membrane protein [Nitrospinota bacterium]|nr:OmpH family outer membrane protein [Nitrospinota bacterium]
MAFADSSLKIAVVDLDRVMNDSLRGKEAREFIEKEIVKTQKIIREREAEAKKLRDELNKKSLVLSESVRKEKEAEYRRELRELKRYANDAEAEIKRKGDELSQKMIKDIGRIIVDVGRKDKFSLILGSRSGLFFYSQDMDITDKITKIYNEQHKKKK